MTEQHGWVTSSSPGRYSIVVAGSIGPEWADHFDGMQLEQNAPGETRLAGFVLDQAALQGVLERLYGLGLPILTVTRLDDDPGSNEQDASAQDVSAN